MQDVIARSEITGFKTKSEEFAPFAWYKNMLEEETFGNGPHFCLGAPLARLEANKAFKTFIEAFSQIEPVAGFDLEASLQPSATGQALSRLPLRVRR